MPTLIFRYEIEHKLQGICILRDDDCQWNENKGERFYYKHRLQAFFAVFRSMPTLGLQFKLPVISISKIHFK